MASFNGVMKQIKQRAEGGDWNGVVALEKEARGIANALRKENPTGAQYLLNNCLGVGFRNLCQYDKALALHAEAKAIAEEVGDRLGLLTTLMNLAICHRHLGQLKQAVDLNQAALAIASEVPGPERPDGGNNRQAQGAILGNLGLCLYERREYQSAIEMHERSKQIAEEVENHKGVAVSCGNIGECYYAMGDYDRAIKQYEKRKLFAEKERDRLSVGKMNEKIGNCYLQLGQYDRVIEHHTETKTIFREIGHHEGVVRMCNSLGTCYDKLEQHDKGNEQRREAMAEEAARGLTIGARVQLHSLKSDGREITVKSSNLNEKANRPSGALHWTDPQWHCFEKPDESAAHVPFFIHPYHLTSGVLSENPEYAAERYRNYGDECRDRGQYEKARALLMQSKNIAERIGHLDGVCKACNSLGILFKYMNQLPTAIGFYEAGKKAALELNSPIELARILNNLGTCWRNMGQYDRALEQYREVQKIQEAMDPAGQSIDVLRSRGLTCTNIANCYKDLGRYGEAMPLYEQHIEIAKKAYDNVGLFKSCLALGDLHSRSGQHVMAIELHKQSKKIAEELEHEQLGVVCHSFGEALERAGDLPAAASVLFEGLAANRRVWSNVEEDVLRISLFDRQDNVYTTLQRVLLAMGQCDMPSHGWALGVAARAKACALSRRLSAGGDDGGNGMEDAEVAQSAGRGGYAQLCDKLWVEVQEQARSEATTVCGELRILEYSFLSSKELAIWVLSGSGELLVSTTVSTVAYQRDAVGRIISPDGLVRMHSQDRALKFGDKVQFLLKEARRSMDVRGRNAMNGISANDNGEMSEAVAEEDKILSEGKNADDNGDGESEASSERGNKCKVCGLRFNQCGCQEKQSKRSKANEKAKANERALLRELYAVLVAPVEDHLTGADEVLIVPHRELFEVPWSALMAADGHYLIERYVLRIAPSLLVACQAANKVKQRCGRPGRPGHVVIVGNPSPLPEGWDDLPCAQREAEKVYNILRRADVVRNVEYFTFFKSEATKSNVQRSLQGAGWAHLALHGDLDSDSIVLACGNDRRNDFVESKLSMLDIQGSKCSNGVRLDDGATVVMSACDTGRGEISSAEGVVGLARGFLLAGAAAVVVSLWAINDESTEKLMEHMYLHLGKGSTVPQALRLAMLRLAGKGTGADHALGVDASREGTGEDVVDGKEEVGKRPMHWAGFLVMGANTRLPSGSEQAQTLLKGIFEIKYELRSRGVSEDEIRKCTERSDLETLLASSKQGT